MGKVPNYCTSEGDQKINKSFICALQVFRKQLKKSATDGPLGDIFSNSDAIKSLGERKHNGPSGPSVL